jgi:hypothetical protein
MNLLPLRDLPRHRRQHVGYCSGIEEPARQFTFQIVWPGDNVLVVKLIELAWPRFPVLWRVSQHKCQHFGAVLNGRVNLDLSNGAFLGIVQSDRAALKTDQRNTKMTARRPLRGQCRRILRIGWPVLHRVYRQPGITKLLGDIFTLLVQISFRCGNKGAIRHCVLG